MRIMKEAAVGAQQASFAKSKSAISPAATSPRAASSTQLFPVALGGRRHGLCSREQTSRATLLKENAMSAQRQSSIWNLLSEKRRHYNPDRVPVTDRIARRSHDFEATLVNGHKQPPSRGRRRVLSGWLRRAAAPGRRKAAFVRLGTCLHTLWNEEREIGAAAASYCLLFLPLSQSLSPWPREITLSRKRCQAHFNAKALHEHAASGVGVTKRWFQKGQMARRE